MLKLSYNLDSVRLIVEGHACFASKGSDIVCSAISALCQLILVGANRSCKEKKVVVEEGYFEFRSPGPIVPEMRYLLEVVLESIKAIVIQNKIKYKIEEVR